VVVGRCSCCGGCCWLQSSLARDSASCCMLSGSINSSSPRSSSFSYTQFTACNKI
jgi:hypothetical protein